MQTENNEQFFRGMKDGMPICLGYFAVAFSLGIAMRNAGMNAIQGFLISMFNMASAGEYAAVQVIAADAAYLEIVIVTLVANARYLLMSTALSQKFSPRTSFIHRFFVGFCVTDELFGIAIAESGYLSPYYYYGAMAVSIPGWSIGTAIGIIAGNILPARIVSALSVALYGMFLAIIVPASKKDKAVMAAVICGFMMSYLTGIIPWFSSWTSGTRTIVLTIVIAGAAALIHPIRPDYREADHHDA